MPNKVLQQTGHATDGCAGFGALSRVNRLLSRVFDLRAQAAISSALRTDTPAQVRVIA